MVSKLKVVFITLPPPQDYRNFMRYTTYKLRLSEAKLTVCILFRFTARENCLLGVKGKIGKDR